jgi:hypothetical protein
MKTQKTKEDYCVGSNLSMGLNTQYRFEIRMDVQGRSNFDAAITPFADHRLKHSISMT